MPEIAIKFENISKQYRLGKIGTGTLSHDLNRWWDMNIRGKEDPNLKVGQVNDRASKSTEDYVWALRNIDFEVKQGEVLGIIGKNGAGKSTLLKILSRVTSPTTGRIKAFGRIASLLEVGTGFHPEMTGRENIYMNGSIMGMNKAEITRKLDEIVDFSGVEKYIDTPVKRYSSGMTVRLGFAIAAHLEPEILVVDEVLAVGDAEFQKKAIGKMQDVSQAESRTILYVSHNMPSVQKLCNIAILLENGTIKSRGETKEIINKYLNGGNGTTKGKINLSAIRNRIGTNKVKISSFWIENEDSNETDFILTGNTIKLIFELNSNINTNNIDVGFSIHSIDGQRLTTFYSSYINKQFSMLESEVIIVKCEIWKFPLNFMECYIKGIIYVDGEVSDYIDEPIYYFNIEKGDFYNSGKNYSTNYLLDGTWTFLNKFH